MKKSKDNQIVKCKYLECENNAEVFTGSHFLDYCSFHNKGGHFHSGDTFEQYQIIERDFIEFINVVPLNEEHLAVHSPVLRDIIIRSCIQIELFFKEWGKESCSKTKEGNLWKKYNEKNKNSNTIKGVRNWNFGDYFVFKKDLDNSSIKIHIRNLDFEFLPFNDWMSEKAPPFWWQIYNLIKHGGDKHKEKYNLKTALYSLSALFYLHVVKYESRKYLEAFNPNIVVLEYGRVIVKSKDITTPIDSKKYLFKANNSVRKREVELASQEQIKRDERLKNKSRI